MGSSSGNSSGSTQLLQNSGSEEDLQNLRKRKRMESNRESARRSRMRKQKHLSDLMDQAEQLRKENNQILSSVSITTQHYLNVEAENSVLRAQMAELSQRLQSLNDILNFMNTTTTSNGLFEFVEDFQTNPYDDGFMNNISNNNSWNLMHLNQPIMASTDMFQY